MSRWFRHYAGMMRDDKLVRVALKSGQTVERVVWVWGAILESAAEIDDHGRYDFDTAEAAYFLRADEADIRAIVASLEDGGRIANGRVVKWGNRQFKSDDSAERVRRYRSKKRETGNGDEEPGQKESGRECNGDVTSECNGDVTLRNGPETETETETEDSVANATGAGAPVSPPPDETPEARLWRVGLTDLIALGVKEQQARKLIGSWRRDTGDDCQGVLAAIARAREYAVADPIPWITASLKRIKTNGKAQTVQSAAADLVDEVRKLNERPAGLRCGEGQAAFRLLPAG